MDGYKGDELRQVRFKNSHSYPVTCLVWHPSALSDFFSSLSCDGNITEIKNWVLISGEGKEEQKKIEIDSNISSISWNKNYCSGDPRPTMFTYSDGGITFWDTISFTKGELRSLRVINGDMNWVKLVRNNYYGHVIAVGFENKTVKIGYIDTFLDIKKCIGHEEDVAIVSCSSDMSRIISCDKIGEIIIWMFSRDESEVRMLKKIKTDTMPTSISLNYNGEKCAVGYNDGTVEIWNIGEDSDSFKIEKWNSNKACAVSWAKDDRIAIGYEDGNIIVFDTIDRRALQRFNDYPHKPCCLTWDPLEVRIGIGYVNGTIEIQGAYDRRREEMYDKDFMRMGNSPGSGYYKLSFDSEKIYRKWIRTRASYF